LRKVTSSASRPPPELLEHNETAGDPLDDLPEDGEPLSATETPAALSGEPSGAISVIQTHRSEGQRREREQLVRALAAAGGNKAEAARALGIARSTLVSKLKRLGLN
jgi:transcriptional regulator of acetoin/glycerol metabolism